MSHPVSALRNIYLGGLILLQPLCAGMHAYADQGSPVPLRPPQGVSVVALGADPDGRSSSSAAFQKAVDSGAPVFVPSGRYRFISSVRLADHSRISAIPDTAILFADGWNTAQQGGLIFVGSNLQDVTVTGIIFDGNSGANTDNRRRLVYVDGADHVVFENDGFRNAAGPALVFSASAQEGVKNSGVRHASFFNIGMNWAGRRDARLREAAVGLIFSNGDATRNVRNFADDNHFSQIGADAIDIHSQGYFEASGNHMELAERGWRPTRATAVSAGVGGFYVFHQSENVTLTGNEVAGATGNCLDIADTSGLVISGNTVSDCGGAGISLANVSDFRVKNNSILRTNKSTLYEIENVAHKGAISFSCGTIRCTGSAANGLLKGNILEHTNPGMTQRHGIWFQRGIATSNMSFVGNRSAAGAAVKPAYDDAD